MLSVGIRFSFIGHWNRLDCNLITESVTILISTISSIPFFTCCYFFFLSFEVIFPSLSIPRYLEISLGSPLLSALLFSFLLISSLSFIFLIIASVLFSRPYWIASHSAWTSSLLWEHPGSTASCCLLLCTLKTTYFSTVRNMLLYDI